MKFIKYLVIALVMNVNTYASTGQSDYGAGELGEYMRNNQQQIAQEVYKIVVEITARLNEECADKYAIPFNKVYIIEPIKFAKDNIHPIEGAWLMKCELSRCNKDRVYNFIFKAVKGSAPKVTNSLMGNTKTSPRLAKDTMLGVYSNTGAKMKAFCKTEDALSSSFIVFDAKPLPSLSIDGSWEEIWSVKACEHVIDIKIKFIPDGKGGTYYHVSDK